MITTTTDEPILEVSGALAPGAPALRGQGAGAGELASEPEPTESAQQQLKEELEETKKSLRCRGGIIHNKIYSTLALRYLGYCEYEAEELIHKLLAASRLTRTLEKEIMRIARKKHKMSEEIARCLSIEDSACFS